MRMWIVVALVCVGFGVATTNACTKKELAPRTYTEVTSQTNVHSSTTYGSRATKPGVVRWDEPASWRRIPAFRIVLAAYQPIEDVDGQPITKQQLQITLSTLEPHAFDLKNNVVRWLAQIDLELGAEELNTFMASISKRKSQSGLPYTFVDSRRLNSERHSRHSLVAIFHLEADRRRQLFVKMMGDKDLVHREEKAFKSLLRSVRLEKASPMPKAKN